MTGKNLGASIRARLLNKARAEKQDFNLLLTRYAIERMALEPSCSMTQEVLTVKYSSPV